MQRAAKKHWMNLRGSAAIVVFLVAAPAAFAQNASPDPRLKPVEQGRGDTGPLATSSRVAPADLRLPLGFEKVYRLDSGGSRTPADLFARRSGGVTAVFKRSQYSQAGNGALVAEIPAGTTFYLGKLPDSLTGADRPARERTLPSNYVDRSAREGRASNSAKEDAQPSAHTAARSAAMGPTRADNGPGRPVSRDVAPRDRVNDGFPRATPPTPRRDVPPRPSVFSDEAYRQKKVGALLDKASEKPDQDKPAAPDGPAAGSPK